MGYVYTLLNYEKNSVITQLIQIRFYLDKFNKKYWYNCTWKSHAVFFYS